jgi:hypothetical protein
MATVIAFAAPASATIQIHQQVPGHDKVFVHMRFIRSLKPLVVDPLLAPSVRESGMTVTFTNDDTLATDLQIVLPGNACVDHGNFCLFTSATALATKTGLASFKLQYKSGRVWIVWYGDTSLINGSHNDALTAMVPGDSTWGADLAFTKKSYGWFNEL